MSQEMQKIETQFLAEIRKNSGMTMVMGIIVILMGLFAMGSPFIAGLSLAMMVGVMLIVGGIAQLVFAIKTGKGILTIILGILTVIIGAYMVSNPGVALASLTIFLAAYLIISG